VVNGDWVYATGEIEVSKDSKDVVLR